MNRIYAQQILEEYAKLLPEVTAYAQKNQPFNRFDPATWASCRRWELQKIYWSGLDGMFVVEWSMYIGCGDTEYETTYVTLENLFL